MYYVGYGLFSSAQSWKTNCMIFVSRGAAGDLDCVVCVLRARSWETSLFSVFSANSILRVKHFVNVCCMVYAEPRKKINPIVPYAA